MSTFSAGSGITRLSEGLEQLGHRAVPPTGAIASIPASLRGSATTPAIADAAAVRARRGTSGALALAASKFRFDVEIAYWPGRLSPFIAMHIEQPDSRHSAPAARKISWSPSRSASRFTSSSPGRSSTHRRTLRSFRTDAASRRSLIRPFVHEPTSDVDLLAEDGLAEPEVHV